VDRVRVSAFVEVMVRSTVFDASAFPT